MLKFKLFFIFSFLYVCMIWKDSLFSMKSIGVIHSPYEEPKDVPIQSNTARKITGTIEIFSEYHEGLKDLEGFSHLILVYYFHLMKSEKLSVIPFLDSKKRGVYSTRAPIRPNHIGISVVQFLRQESNILHVQGLDILDNTPLLDIKPYVPKFDRVDAGKESIRIGWLESPISALHHTKDDGRFLEE